MIKKIVTLAICVFLVQSAFAAGFGIYNNASSTSISTSSPAFQTGKVEGTVSDPQGAKVADARVVLLDLTGAAVGETKTDAQGRFSFANVAPGRYTVQVDAPGFSLPDSPDIEVKKGVTAQLNRSEEHTSELQSHA